MSSNGNPSDFIQDPEEDPAAVAIAIMQMYLGKLKELETERDQMVVGLMIALAERGVDSPLVVPLEALEMHELYFGVHRMYLASDAEFDENGELIQITYHLVAHDEDDSADSR